MPETLSIVSCDRLDGDTVLVELSDGTSFSLKLDQILTLDVSCEPAAQTQGEDN